MLTRSFDGALVVLVYGILKFFADCDIADSSLTSKANTHCYHSGTRIPDRTPRVHQEKTLAMLK